MSTGKKPATRRKNNKDDQPKQGVSSLARFVPQDGAAGATFTTAKQQQDVSNDEVARTAMEDSCINQGTTDDYVNRQSSLEQFAYREGIVSGAAFTREEMREMLVQFKDEIKGEISAAGTPKRDTKTHAFGK